MKIQVKARYEGDDLMWEDRPILFSFMTEGISDEMGDRIVEISTQFSITGFIEYFVGLLEDKPVEIRWNFQDSSQGHYRFMGE